MFGTRVYVSRYRVTVKNRKEGAKRFESFSRNPSRRTNYENLERIFEKKNFLKRSSFERKIACINNSRIKICLSLFIVSSIKKKKKKEPSFHLLNYSRRISGGINNLPVNNNQKKHRQQRALSIILIYQGEQ